LRNMAAYQNSLSFSLRRIRNISTQQIGPKVRTLDKSLSFQNLLLVPQEQPEPRSSIDISTYISTQAINLSKTALFTLYSSSSTKLYNTYIQPLMRQKKNADWELYFLYNHDLQLLVFTAFCVWQRTTFAFQSKRYRPGGGGGRRRRRRSCLLMRGRYLLCSSRTGWLWNLRDRTRA